MQERALSLSAASELWHQVVSKHQLIRSTTEYTSHGFSIRLDYLTGEFLTNRGVGKGATSEDIDISARYEALEFFFAGYHNYASPILRASYKEISQNYKVHLYRCDAELFLQEATKSKMIPWVIYQNISNAEKLAVPLACVDLTYCTTVVPGDTMNYEACKTFAASNGLASGATYEEALIHGALELIERDAYSYSLIDIFILKKTPLVIDKQTLPKDLQALVQKIERNFQNAVVILQTPSRFGAYVYIATFSNKIFSIPPRGAGASLCSKHALERALYELIQTHHLVHGNFVQGTLNTKLLDNNLLIKKFLEFDCEEIFKSNHYTSIPFVDNENDFQGVTLNDYLGQISQLLHTQATSLYVNQIYQEKGFTCVRVIIPEAEEFFLGTHYLKLKPQPKTELYLMKTLGHKFCWNHFLF